MTKRLSKSPKSASVLPTDYAPLLADIIAQQQTLIFQIQNFRRMRDLLLAPLLSGQVELNSQNEAEAM